MQNGLLSCDMLSSFRSIHNTTNRQATGQDEIVTSNNDAYFAVASEQRRTLPNSVLIIITYNYLKIKRKLYPVKTRRICLCPTIISFRYSVNYLVILF